MFNNVVFSENTIEINRCIFVVFILSLDIGYQQSLYRKMCHFKIVINYFNIYLICSWSGYELFYF